MSSRESGEKAPRVLMFCPRFDPFVGGAERQASRQAGALMRMGVPIEVLTLRLDHSTPRIETRSDGVVIHRVTIRDLTATSVPTIRGIGLLNTPFMGRQVRGAIHTLARRFDVFHAHNASSPITAHAVGAARCLGLKTFVKAVNTGEWFDLSVLRRQPFWGDIAARRLLRDVDGWFAISEAVRDELITSGVAAARIFAVPNGVELPSAPKALPSVVSRFLYLGRLDRTAPRDIRGLICAFAAVKDRCPSVELALVGGGDQLEDTRQLVSSCRARTAIHVVGQQSSSDWLAWAHCLVQPSFFEGMSNALLEAMAAGLACVAYDIPPNREALADGTAGELVPVGRIDELGEAMSRLATTSGTAARIGAAAHARAAAWYDVNTIAARACSAYGSVMQGTAFRAANPTRAAIAQ